VEKLLRQGACPNGLDLHGNTSLIAFVCGAGNTMLHGEAVLKTLLEANADVNVVNKRHATALHYSYTKGLPVVTREMLRHGGAESLKVLNMKDQYPRDCMQARPATDKPEVPWQLPFPKTFKVITPFSRRFNAI